jgi:hypothetical protein
VGFGFGLAVDDFFGAGAGLAGFGFAGAGGGALVTGCVSSSPIFDRKASRAFIWASVSAARLLRGTIPIAAMQATIR